METANLQRTESLSRYRGLAAAPPSEPLRLVALGGGTGLPAVLRGFLHAADRHSGAHACTGIVTVMDDGGSSGALRQALGMLPPGDIRNCLSALTPETSSLGMLLQERRHAAGSEHPLGNLLLAALNELHGDFLQAVDNLGAMLGASGRVLPATLGDTNLIATFADGSETAGETAIANRRVQIRRVRLAQSVRPLPEAIEALINADLIVVGPGSLYTSLLPTLLVEGMAATLSAIAAPRVYVANLMTQPGETDGYTLADHVAALRDHTGHDLFDYVLVNRRQFSAAALERYRRDGAIPVRHDERQPWTFRTRIVTADIGVTAASGVVRHDPAALGFALTALARRRPRPHVQ